MGHLLGVWARGRLDDVGMIAKRGESVCKEIARANRLVVYGALVHAAFTTMLQSTRLVPATLWC